MITAVFATTIDDPWRHLEPVRLGDASVRDPAPERYVLIEGDDWRMRCDIRVSEAQIFVFEGVKVWGDLLIVGFGHDVFCVDVRTRRVTTHKMRHHLCGFHFQDDYFLIASGDALTRLGPEGAAIWRTDLLAIDGVIVHNVEDGVITGDAEWDPPGGWRPFAVSLATGKILTG